MSKEQAPNRPEGYLETPRESHERSHEHAEHHQPSPERHSEKEAHQAAENARHEQNREKRTRQAQRHNSSHMGREDREASFDQTMEHTRTELPRALRPFSRFIHNPTVEGLSEFLGKTIFRPNAVLAGGITAFVAVLGLYFYAKYAGFALKGSETIIAFGVGWVLGMLFDLFKGMFTGRR
ncbi:MAG TPA: hypothetical protein VJM46_00045 [Candidatus Saccharimonadales bacterium]|nr:hypothetical protein [Candidatus Saccharimonadales bacterium]